MSHRNIRLTGALVSLALAALLLFVPAPQGQRVMAHPAATSVITFICCQYSPSTVNVVVGDTVTWQGQFSSHPLNSDDGL